MSFATRTILILMLTLPTIGKLVAQETTDTTETTATTTTATDAAATDTTETTTATGTTTATDTTGTDARDVASYEIRNQFRQLLLRHPDDLATVLAFDPSLLNNQQFVSGYPELARFIARHPEVVAAPRFYLAEFAHRTRREGAVEDVMESIVAVSAFLLATFAIGWFIRTLLEQRRWNRLSRTQAEVHNKILDRFGTTGELLEYVKSPAGSKFLESAPIPLHAPEPVTQKQNMPLQRILWTVQAGVVLGAMGLGMLLISLRYSEGNGEGIFALGAIALCLGGGFIASSAVSLFLSRRLGLWQGPQSPEPGPLTGDRYDVS